MKNLKETKPGYYELYEGNEPCTCPFQTPILAPGKVLRQRCGSYCPLFTVSKMDVNDDNDPITFIPLANIQIGCAHQCYSLDVPIKANK